MTLKSLTKLVPLLLVLSLASSLPAADIDSNHFGGIKARMIGPAVMSGRITAIAGVNRDPNIIYVGTAGGGVWKSINRGTTFQRVFDRHSLSIGCITIDQDNPDTLWVGTGETNVRNSVSIGSGLYKTVNGGRTWDYVAFEDSERIRKVVLHPQKPDTLYVAVLGHLWDAHPERGLYRSTDGGSTWDRILYADPDTGCTDVEIDPQNPRILYAAMWQFRRKPYFFNSGGPGCGLYKSLDGGETWRKIQQGLPDPVGRIEIALAPTRTSRLYALVESRQNALYLSDDLGEHWRKVSESILATLRPFYFWHLEVDPEDFKRIYIPNFALGASDNEGETISAPIMGSVHSDIHAIWINPREPRQILLGTDGGVYLSHDRGNHFFKIGCLPVSQFYHVYYDLENPYQVYGGLQDNGGWRGPSKSYEGFIKNKDWTPIGSGDGFHVIPHPSDPMIIYYTWQGGRLQRHNLRTHEAKDIQPLPTDEREPSYRYNWNAAVAVSPTNPEILYTGAQFLFKSTDRGDSWKKISPDLTTDDPQKQQQAKSGGLTIDDTTAENHCTIFTIAQSPLDENLIWVGTDDGNLQMTRDGGKVWTNLVRNIPKLPAFTWCSHVEPSRFEPGTVYATFDGHRSGDRSPYVYRSDDYGLTWQKLSSGTIKGYCHVVKEDPVNRDLLFLGTEFGLHVSLDRGENWVYLSEATPPVSIRDMKIHPREHDLIIGTHGLGIMIIDDLTPLRSLTPGIFSKKASVLPSKPVIMEIPFNSMDFPSDNDYAGENPPQGAVIYYYLKSRHIFGDLEIEIYDQDNRKIITLPTSKRRGINRVSWNMRLKPPRSAHMVGLSSSMVFAGPMVREGEYRVKLIKGKDAFEGKIELRPNPLTGHPRKDRELRYDTVMKLYHLLEEFSYSANHADMIIKKIKGIQDPAVQEKLENYREIFEKYHQGIVQHGGLMTGEKLREKLADLYSSIISYSGKPTRAQIYNHAVLQKEVQRAEARFQGLVNKYLPRINRLLAKENLATISLPSKQEYLNQR